MGDAIANGATVLAADRDGAITQTGNGRVSGYRRQTGEQVWSTKYKRFEEGPSNPFGAGANDAAAWCTSACPAALLEFKSEFNAFGGASQWLATELNYAPPEPKDLFAVTETDTAFVRATSEQLGKKLLQVIAPGKPTKPLGNLTPSALQPAQPKRRAVAGAAKGAVGVITQLELTDGLWQRTGRPISQNLLKNICMSDDEQWIGAVGVRVSRFAFGAQPGAEVGPAMTGATCTVDDSGITAIYAPKAIPNTLAAARYSASGRRIWLHDFGAQRLLSPAGAPIVVTQAADGNVTAIDAVSGRNVYRGKIAGVPFVGRDGSIVTANREGEPHWVLLGEAVAR
jgi:hypothetical protein